jgi:hypothetical protein
MVTPYSVTFDDLKAFVRYQGVALSDGLWNMIPHIENLRNYEHSDMI